VGVGEGVGVGLCVPSTLFGLRSAWHLFAHSETLAAKLGKLRYPKKEKKEKSRVYIFGELLGGSFVKRTGFDDNSIELGTSVAFFLNHFPLILLLVFCMCPEFVARS